MRRLVLVLALACLLVPCAAAQAADPPDVAPITERRVVGDAVLLRSWYPTWNGHRRALLIAYPRTAPPGGVPLLVTNRPAGLSLACSDERGIAAARGGYALACLAGQGVATSAFSYGSAGQIADLARAPALVQTRMPDVRVDPTRVYLAGSSMGGTEALLVALRYPHAYTRVVALSPITDLGLRWASLPLNRRVPLEAECGGTPLQRPLCYEARSPSSLVATATALPAELQVWYAPSDRIAGEPRQAPAFVAALADRRLPGSLTVHTGAWSHGELWDSAPQRRTWLSGLGLPVARRG